MDWTTKDTPFWDSSKPIDERIDCLLAELTMDEKLGMLSSWSSPVERLGIRRMAVGGEAAHGVEARNDQNELGTPEPTTSFPQPIGMSASWDPELIREAGEVTGVEARVIFHRHPDRGLSRWAPTVDLCRDPRWGRNEEGYGEDPLLTGVMASAYIQGMQGNHPHYLRCAATLKHFYGNNMENGRVWKNSTIDPRNRMEYYFEPFRRCIEQGKAQGVMTAYNRINGVVGMLNHEVKDILKNQYGLVHAVSDGGATGMVVSQHHEFGLHGQTIAAALRAGVDSMSDDQGYVTQAAREAYVLGLITESDVDNALRNTFRTKLRLGIYDKEKANPYDQVKEEDLCSPHHQEVCRQLTRESVVLLKNNDCILPLKESEDIVVIGPVAHKWYQDWYCGEPHHRHTLLNGIETLVGKRVAHTDGLDRVILRVGDRYLSVREDDRLVLSDQPERFIHTDWGEGSHTLHCERTKKCLRVRMPYGQFADMSTMGQIAADKDDPFDFFELAVFSFVPQSNGEILLNTFFGIPITLQEDGTVGNQKDGNALSVNLEVVDSGAHRALKYASEHHTVILALGSNPSINAKETSDRTTLALPPDQEALLKTVQSVNKNIILVLLTNYPHTLGDNLDLIPGMLWSATGSQDMGDAVAEALFGVYSPAGRLNQTWVADVAHLPSMDDYDIIQGNRTYRYFNREPLFPFGYGLTYSSFSYSDLKIELLSDLTISASLSLFNNGKFLSDEVVQLYAVSPGSKVKKPLRQLVAFQRVKDVLPGETRRITFRFAVEELRFYDVVRRRLLVEEGTYAFYAGSHSLDVQVIQELQIPGEKMLSRTWGTRIPADHYDTCTNVELIEGLFGFSAARPLVPDLPATMRYLDFYPTDAAQQIRMFLKSEEGCSIRVMLNGKEAAAWSGETKTYGGGSFFAPDPPEKLSRQKAIFVEMVLPIHFSGDKTSPVDVEIQLAGDGELCFFCVEEGKSPS